MRRNRWGLSGWVYSLLIGAALVIGAGPGCQTPARQATEPVAMRPPAELVDRLKRAQADFVGALRRMATDYDRAVCDERSVRAAQGFGRQAIGEAALEVARARQAAQHYTQARGGGPAQADDGITLIEEPAAAPPARLPWHCVQAEAQPACVQSTANSVGLRVYRAQVDGYDLDPLIVSDVLEAFADDLRWAGDYLSGAASTAAAFEAIEQGCEAGESPLNAYFAAVNKTEDSARRAGLKQLKADLIGAQVDLCAALPAFYAHVIQDLGTSLAHHSRTQHCVNKPWAILE